MDSGDGVTVRRLATLKATVRSTLFPSIHRLLSAALTALIQSTGKDITAAANEVFTQIGQDLEMLKGSEAKVLAKNGNYLQRLEAVVDDVLKDLERVGQLLAPVRKQAIKDGYV